MIFISTGKLTYQDFCLSADPYSSDSKG